MPNFSPSVILFWIPLALIYVITFLGTAMLGLGIPFGFEVGFASVSMLVIISPWMIHFVKGVLAAFVLAACIQAGEMAFVLAALCFGPWSILGVFFAMGYSLHVGPDGVALRKPVKKTGIKVRINTQK